MDIRRDERIFTINSLLFQDGSALDIGSGPSFGQLYPQRNFSRVVALNVCAPLIDTLRADPAYINRSNWEFLVLDVRDYFPEEEFNVITMLHVAEHLTLPDLTIVLNRLSKVCRGVFVLETPEQFDDNKRSVKDKENPYEEHRSLVTLEFLSDWNFQLKFRYWQNSQFSNAIYVLECGKR